MSRHPRYGDDFAASESIPWYSHLQLYVMLFLIFVFILWASVAEMDEVARADGRVVPAAEVQLVQSLEGGIVEKLLVKEGQAVGAGETLVHIRNTQAKSEYAAIRRKYLGLLASTQRLEAEAQGGELAISDEILKEAPENALAEQDAFIANRRRFEGEMDILRQQKLQKEQAVTELEARIANTEKVFVIAQSSRDMVAPMVEKGAASKMELLALDQQLAEQRAEIESLKLSLPGARASVDELSGRIEQLQRGFRAEAQRELAQKAVDLNTIREQIAGYQDRSDRSEIKSPVSGTVKDIRLTTEGGVARPGETIMEIVPAGNDLLVEARVKPSDIAFLHAGQKAVVRLTAFDFGIYGAFEGKVEDISADALMTEKGESFYRVKIRTDATRLEKDGKDYVLIPGMQANVDIVTGRKTVMSYLLKPFIKGSQTALRER